MMMVVMKMKLWEKNLNYMTSKSIFKYLQVFYLHYLKQKNKRNNEEIT